MIKLNPYIHKKERIIESLTKSNEIKEAKIEELKNKIPSKRRKTQKIRHKNNKKTQQKEKKLKREIDKNKEKIRKYKAQIKEHIEYKNTIKKIFNAKSLKTAMKYYNQSYDKIEELPATIQDFIKKLSKKIDNISKIKKYQKQIIQQNYCSK